MNEEGRAGDVLIVGSDSLAEGARRAAEIVGLRAIHIADPSGLVPALEERRPAAVLVDMTRREGDLVLATVSWLVARGEEDQGGVPGGPTTVIAAVDREFLVSGRREALKDCSDFVLSRDGEICAEELAERLRGAKRVVEVGQKVEPASQPWHQLLERLLQQEGFRLLGQNVPDLAAGLYEPLEKVSQSTVALREATGAVLARLEAYQKAFVEAELPPPPATTIEIELGADEARPEVEIVRHLSRLQQGVRRIRNVTRPLAQFDQETEQTSELVNVSELLDGALDLFQDIIRTRATLVRDFATVPDIPGRRSELLVAVLSILRNSCQAIPIGSPTVNCIAIGTRVEGDRIAIKIADSGVGMTADAKARAFESFYTTRSEAGALGLGLTLARMNVERFGGKVELDSSPGQGTTVTVEFPVPTPR